GGTAPCVMNAANEAAAEAFLAGRCGFLDVTNLVEHTLERHSPVAAGLEALLETDAWARETVSAALRS
ncbi:MAG: 1-deoxy-D-xylulose-5-phosphate reductoisomerase, partial [Fimbriimonadaceae bacterium]